MWLIYNDLSIDNSHLNNRPTRPDNPAGLALIIAGSSCGTFHQRNRRGADGHGTLGRHPHFIHRRGSQLHLHERSGEGSPE